MSQSKLEKHVNKYSVLLLVGQLTVTPWLVMILLGALYHRTDWAVNLDYITVVIIVAIIQFAYPETHTRITGYVDYLMKNPQERKED